jgi:hypothetical protein
MIKFIKKYPVSTKFTLSLLVFGLVAVLANSTLLRVVCAIAFVADIWHFYKSGGAGDR